MSVTFIFSRQRARSNWGSNTFEIVFRHEGDEDKEDGQDPDAKRGITYQVE